jgi:hypothetical protein
LLHYQGHRGSERMDGKKNVSREISIAQRELQQVQQLAWMCC